MGSRTALPKLYIGIDIHKKSWEVKDISAGKTITMPASTEQLQEYIQKG